MLVVRNPSANAEDVRDRGWIPGLRRSAGGGNGDPLQYSCLENPMNRGAWRATVHSVTMSPKALKTQLKQLSTYTHGFSSSQVWMWELDSKEGWASKINALELWCWTILVIIPWTARKSNQPILTWIFIGEIDAEAEAPTLTTLWDNLTHWKRSWCWERLKAKRGRGNRGWDG